jgi:hypothetical protein
VCRRSTRGWSAGTATSPPSVIPRHPGWSPPITRGKARTTPRGDSLSQLAAAGEFGEYFEPFTGKQLGSTRQSWTAADEVVSPYGLTGRRMAVLAVQPSVLEVLDLLNLGSDIKLEEVAVQAGTHLDGLTIAEARARYAGVVPRRLPGWSRPAGSIAFTSVISRDPAKAKRRPALQRLLHATARGLGAAFHTQPLRSPLSGSGSAPSSPATPTRRYCSGSAAVASSRRSPRRPVGDVLRASSPQELPAGRSPCAGIARIRSKGSPSGR